MKEQLGVVLEGVSYGDHRWRLGDVRIDGLDRHCHHVRMSPEHGTLSLFPLPSTEVWQFRAAIPADDSDPVAPTVELFRRLFAERPHRPRLPRPREPFLLLLIVSGHYQCGRGNSVRTLFACDPAICEPRVLVDNFYGIGSNWFCDSTFRHTSEQSASHMAAIAIASGPLTNSRFNQT
ncbi:hypothetical protein [Nocardia sp. NPDC004604]|uniref:hypothetical protein n=1 Tax=Nocardia sp. NPDC004604 TaxID=3157013 RepID=UPI0033B97321